MRKKRLVEKEKESGDKNLEKIDLGNYSKYKAIGEGRYKKINLFHYSFSLVVTVMGCSH